MTYEEMIDDRIKHYMRNFTKQELAWTLAQRDIVEFDEE